MSVRDYRPQTFADTFGQNHIKITIANELKSGKNSGAYLFCGPRAVGKTTLARIFAKALNCQERKSGESEPCNHCTSCLSVTNGKNLDVLEIDAASNTGVDHVRENILASARMAPSGNLKKVFIIDEAHMLSTSAWNALLKVMEEPPSHVVFILCTTEIHKVPLTIISRCERFDFKRISTAEIIEKLSRISRSENIEVDKEVLEAIARQSGGHLRDAESLLGQLIAAGGNKITAEQTDLFIPKSNNREIIEMIDYLEKKDAAKAIRLINNLVDSGLNIKNFTAETIDILRKILLNKVSPGLAESLGLDFGQSLELKITELESRLSLEKITRYTEKFITLAQEQKGAFIMQLPLELVIVELCLLDCCPKTPLGVNPSNKFSPSFDSTPVNKNSSASNKVGIAEGNIKKETITKINLKAEVPFEEILEKWSEVLVRIKQSNHSLSFVLHNCRPESLNGQDLILVFKYKFHQDRINQAEIKTLVETVLQEVYNTVLNIETRLDEKISLAEREDISSEETKKKPEKNNDSQPNQFLNNLLQNFGGEIVS